MKNSRLLISERRCNGFEGDLQIGTFADTEPRFDAKSQVSFQNDAMRTGQQCTLPSVDIVDRGGVISSARHTVGAGGKETSPSPVITNRVGNSSSLNRRSEMQMIEANVVSAELNSTKRDAAASTTHDNDNHKYDRDTEHRQHAVAAPIAQEAPHAPDASNSVPAWRRASSTAYSMESFSDSARHDVSAVVVSSLARPESGNSVHVSFASALKTASQDEVHVIEFVEHAPANSHQGIRRDDRSLFPQRCGESASDFVNSDSLKVSNMVSREATFNMHGDGVKQDSRLRSVCEQDVKPHTVHSQNIVNGSTQPADNYESDIQRQKHGVGTRESKPEGAHSAEQLRAVEKDLAQRMEMPGGMEARSPESATRCGDAKEQRGDRNSSVSSSDKIRDVVFSIPQVLIAARAHAEESKSIGEKRGVAPKLDIALSVKLADPATKTSVIEILKKLDEHQGEAGLNQPSMRLILAARQVGMEKVGELRAMLANAENGRPPRFDAIDEQTMRGYRRLLSLIIDHLRAKNKPELFVTQQIKGATVTDTIVAGRVGVNANARQADSDKNVATTQRGTGFTSELSRFPIIAGITRQISTDKAATMTEQVTKNGVSDGVGACDVSREVYTVRLGETLRSIALRHAALNDVRLWTLLAQVNGLSIDKDHTGRPLEVLQSGQKLVMPTPAEVEAFLALSATVSPEASLEKQGYMHCPSCNGKRMIVQDKCAVCKAVVRDNQTGNSQFKPCREPLYIAPPVFRQSDKSERSLRRLAP